MHFVAGFWGKVEQDIPLGALELPTHNTKFYYSSKACLGSGGDLHFPRDEIRVRNCTSGAPVCDLEGNWVGDDLIAAEMLYVTDYAAEMGMKFPAAEANINSSGGTSGSTITWQKHGDVVVILPWVGTRLASEQKVEGPWLEKVKNAASIVGALNTGVHWVLFYIQDAVFHVRDSINNNMHQMYKDMAARIAGVRGRTSPYSVKVESTKQQHDGHTCGLWTVDNYIALLHEDAPANDLQLVCQRAQRLLRAVAARSEQVMVSPYRCHEDAKGRIVIDH